MQYTKWKSSFESIRLFYFQSVVRSQSIIEREGQRERQSQRDREREKDGKRYRYRQTARQRDKDKGQSDKLSTIYISFTVSEY